MHRMAIYAIKKDAEKFFNLFEESMSIGQAQKWLNMSIKYMRMMSVLNKSIDSEDIHVPVDNYVIDAVKKNGKISELFDVEGLGIEISFNGAWSRINDYNKYLELQNKIRKKLEERKYIPIDWEAEAWIA